VRLGDQLAGVLLDFDFLAAKVARFGIDALLRDVRNGAATGLEGGSELPRLAGERFTGLRVQEFPALGESHACERRGRNGIHAAPPVEPGLPTPSDWQ
jgi:hypothetical protein